MRYTTLCIYVWHYNYSMKIDRATINKIQSDLRNKEREDQQLLQLSVTCLLADAFTDLPDDALSANRRRVLVYQHHCPPLHLVFLSHVVSPTRSSVQKSLSLSYENQGGRSVCLIMDLSPIVFAPYHADLQLSRLFSSTRDLEF